MHARPPQAGSSNRVEWCIDALTFDKGLQKLDWVARCVTEGRAMGNRAASIFGPQRLGVGKLLNLEGLRIP